MPTTDSRSYTSVSAAELRKQIRELHARLTEAVSLAQSECSHRQGGHALSTFATDKTSIFWHRMPNHDVIGVCPNCQRVFRPQDEDYAFWYGEPHGNTLSENGEEHPLTIEERVMLRRNLMETGVRDPQTFCSLDREPATILIKTVAEVHEALGELTDEEFLTIIRIRSGRTPRWG